MQLEKVRIRGMEKQMSAEYARISDMTWNHCRVLEQRYIQALQRLNNAEKLIQMLGEENEISNVQLRRFQGEIITLKAENQILRDYRETSLNDRQLELQLARVCNQHRRTHELLAESQQENSQLISDMKEIKAINKELISILKLNGINYGDT